jgi:hypothetical protein
MAKFGCLCCGYLTLDEEPSGTYAICPMCSWEDDVIQARKPNYAGGAERMSHNEALENLRRGGVSGEWSTKHVRPPMTSEYLPGHRGHKSRE